MFLDSASKSLEIILGTTQTTNPMPVVVDYTDKAGEHETAGASFDTQTSGTTAVTILNAAASSNATNTRIVKEISVIQADTVAKTVTIRMNNNGTMRTKFYGVLQPGDMLGYTLDDGWYVNDANGNRKTIASSATLQAQLSAPSGSSLIGHQPAGTGSVPTTVQEVLLRSKSIFDFLSAAQIADVVSYGGTLDLTIPVQTALTACVLSGQTLFFPVGKYLVTGTLNITPYTSIKGESQSSVSDVNLPYKATVIQFSPASASSLFVCNGTADTYGYRPYYNVEGLQIIGNSASSVGNSIYAFDVNSVIYSRFKNISIVGFRTGIRAYATIGNRFESIYIQQCYISDVLYDGGIATTDVWEQCTLRQAPIGVQTNGQSLAIRWVNCLFETIDNYGVNLVKECFQWQFLNCYAENIPAVTPNVNGAMFRVGYDGVAQSGFAVPIMVIGGYFGGNNSAGTGNFLDMDTSYGACVTGTFVARYPYVIRATANTLLGSVAVSASQFVSGIGFYTGPAGVLTGNYPSGALNSGAGYSQVADAKTMYTDTVYAHDASGASLGLGASAVTIGGTTTSFYPAATDGTINLGLSNQHWKAVYSKTIVLSAAVTVAPAAGSFAMGSDPVATATTGAAGAPPAQVAGYLRFFIGATSYKLPYYNE